VVWESDIIAIGQRSTAILLLMAISGMVAILTSSQALSRWFLHVSIVSIVTACILQTHCILKEWKLRRCLRSKIKAWLTELDKEAAEPLRMAWRGTRFPSIYLWWMLLCLAMFPVILLPVPVPMPLFATPEMAWAAGTLHVLYLALLAMTAYTNLYAYRRVLMVLDESRRWRRIRKLEA